MSFESTSPNMNLVLPGVGLTSGPQWSSDLNVSLTIIDSHNHSAGQGVPINPSGIDINTDLSFNNNNATSLRSANFQIQASPLSSPADLGCLYVSGVDLYYNDELGNRIQITSGGNVNAGAGSITGLTSPASATYVSGSQTFVWQSNVNTAANMDMGSIILRKIVASSAGITIAPPSSLSSSYTITLPAAPPAFTSFLRMNNSGTVSADVVVDGSTILLSGGQLQVGTITGSNITTNVNLSGNTVQENSKNVVVSNTNAASSLAIVRGGVSSTGAIINGEGFTASRTATGRYTITFTTAFASSPSVVVCLIGPTTNIVAETDIATTTQCFASGLIGGTNTPANMDFYFIAIGPRA